MSTSLFEEWTEMGMPLRIPREYIRSGLRGRAEEIATDILGYRSPADAHRGPAARNASKPVHTLSTASCSEAMTAPLRTLR